MALGFWVHSRGIRDLGNNNFTRWVQKARQKGWELWWLPGAPKGVIISIYPKTSTAAAFPLSPLMTPPPPSDLQSYGPHFVSSLDCCTHFPHVEPGEPGPSDWRSNGSHFVSSTWAPSGGLQHDKSSPHLGPSDRRSNDPHFVSSSSCLL